MSWQWLVSTVSVCLKLRGRETWTVGTASAESLRRFQKTPLIAAGSDLQQGQGLKSV